jgi:hypothetical protein
MYLKVKRPEIVRPFATRFDLDKIDNMAQAPEKKSKRLEHGLHSAHFKRFQNDPYLHINLLL